MATEEKLPRITVSLDKESETALGKIRRRDTVKNKIPNASASVRKALVNEAKTK